jgi:SAM-dependent methyltransferase
VTEDVWGLGQYERLIAPRLLEASEAAIEALALRPGERVLDVAAGTGNSAVLAARAGAEVHATDLSPRMIALGAARTEGLEVTWSEADAQDLPFEDGRFDAVVSVFGAMFAPDQARTASELLRVTRSGGRVAMTGWVPEGPQFAAMRIVMAAFPDRPPMANDWGDPATARHLFEEAGAAEVTIDRRTTHWDFESPEQWLEFTTQGPGPMVASIAALGDRWPAIREEMLAALPVADGPFEVRSPYLLITARR